MLGKAFCASGETLLMIPLEFCLSVPLQLLLLSDIRVWPPALGENGGVIWKVCSGKGQGRVLSVKSTTPEVHAIVTLCNAHVR